MRVKVWDLPLRLFHWSLVIAIISAYVTATLGGSWLTWHERTGIFILSLTVFRFVWGFVGSTTSRFSQFFPTPGRMKKFLSSTWSGVGHNPLGAVSVFTLLLVMFFQACLGLFAMDEDADFYGPLYKLISSSLSERITTWHGSLFYVLLSLIVLHIGAVFYYLRFKNKNLIKPMITGISVVADEDNPDSIQVDKDWHHTNHESSSNTLFSVNKAAPVILALAIAGIVFWLIESGTLVSIVVPASPPVVVPNW